MGGVIFLAQALHAAQPECPAGGVLYIDAQIIQPHIIGRAIAQRYLLTCMRAMAASPSTSAREAVTVMMGPAFSRRAISFRLLA